MSNLLRLSHARAVQIEVRNLGVSILDPTSTKKKSVTALQSWVQQNFSSIVLAFFLSIPEKTIAVHPTSHVRSDTINPESSLSARELSDEEKAVQLWPALVDLLNQYVVPSVKSAIESCQDQSDFSKTFTQSLALARKKWDAFMMSARIMLTSVDDASGSATCSLFHEAFQITVVEVFRSNIVAAVHELAKQLRDAPARIPSDAAGVQELIKPFFDEKSNSSSQSEQAHFDTKKLEDFHDIFILPYKSYMRNQYLKVVQEFEMKNDLLGLLSWIPRARKIELDLVRSLFLNVYPADFEMLCNNIMYEFDIYIVFQNALRLIDHDQFGVCQTVKQLAIENASSSANDEASPNDPNALLHRLHDLFVVATTAQKASSMPEELRSLPRTVARNARTIARRTNCEPTVAPDVEALAHFKAAIHEHGNERIAAVVGSFRAGLEVPNAVQQENNQQK